MMKEFDVKNYKKLKNEIKQMYLNDKLGESRAYETRTKLFKPIIDTTKQTTEHLEQKLIDDRQNLTNVIVPFTNELMRSNDQRDAIQNLPFYSSEIPEGHDEGGYKESTPKKEIIKVDLDKDLNKTDRENLDLLKLSLPNEVYNRRQIDQTLESIAAHNREIGQYLGARSKKTEDERNKYESQKITLEKYRTILKNVKAGKELIGEGLKPSKKLVKQKRGRGRPKTNNFIVYTDPQDLIQKLSEYVMAYRAGNNGVYNTIVEILDELLNKEIISKNIYDNIYKNNFKNV